MALNGASRGFPAIEKDVFAFREVGGRIGLGSLYGLMAFCTNKLEVSDTYNINNIRILSRAQGEYTAYTVM